MDVQYAIMMEATLDHTEVHNSMHAGAGGGRYNAFSLWRVVLSASMVTTYLGL